MRLEGSSPRPSQASQLTRIFANGSGRSISGMAAPLNPETRTVPPLMAARLDRDLTREGLARKSGLSSRTIYSIEREGVQPHRSTRAVLAAILDVPESELFPA